jgi:hypothetical protein
MFALARWADSQVGRTGDHYPDDENAKQTAPNDT